MSGETPDRELHGRQREIERDLHAWRSRREIGPGSTGSSMSQQSEGWIITLRPLKSCRYPILALRSLLKHALRVLDLKCTDVRPVSQPAARAAQPKESVS